MEKNIMNDTYNESRELLKKAIEEGLSRAIDKTLASYPPLTETLEEKNTNAET